VFLWENGEMKDLYSLIAASDPLKLHIKLLDVDDINNLGQILVRGRDSRTNTRRSFLVSPTYRFTSFISPSGNSVPVGSVVRIAIGLLDTANVRIPDTRARLLAGGPCRVQVRVTGAQSVPKSCMRYDATTNQFYFDWSLSSNEPGTSTIDVRVNYGAPTPLKILKTKTITITS
jgi:hypothetical protein